MHPNILLICLFFLLNLLRIMIIMSSLNLFYAYSLVNIQAMYKLKLFPMRNFSLLLLLLFIYLFTQSRTASFPFHLQT